MKITDILLEKQSIHQAIQQRLDNPREFMEYYFPELIYMGWYKDCDQSIALKEKFAVMGAPRCGKSIRYGTIEALREVCRDPFNARIGFVSKSQDKAQNFMATVAKHLQKNERILEDFGDFKDKGLLWNRDEIWVRGHNPTSNTPSVSNLGAMGQIESQGYTLLVLDDPVDMNTTLSQAETQHAVDRFFGTYITRLQPGGRLILVGHRFGPVDAYKSILPYFDGDVFTLPALDEKGESTHPELWSTERLLDTRERMSGGMGDAMWGAIYQQDPVAGGNEFNLDWILEHKTTDIPGEVVVAIDPAYTENKKNDYTGGVALGVCGSVSGLQGDEDRIVVVGLWGPRMASNFEGRIRGFMERYGARGGSVEVNNCKTLGTSCRESGVMVDDYLAKKGKEYRIGSLQPLVKRGVVCFHDDCLVGEDWERFREELLYFPNGAHEHVLDALAQGVEVLRKGGMGSVDIGALF